MWSRCKGWSSSTLPLYKTSLLKCPRSAHLQAVGDRGRHVQADRHVHGRVPADQEVGLHLRLLEAREVRAQPPQPGHAAALLQVGRDLVDLGLLQGWGRRRVRISISLLLLLLLLAAGRRLLHRRHADEAAGDAQVAQLAGQAAFKIQRLLLQRRQRQVGGEADHEVPVRRLRQVEVRLQLHLLHALELRGELPQGQGPAAALQEGGDSLQRLLAERRWRGCVRVLLLLLLLPLGLRQRRRESGSCGLQAPGRQHDHVVGAAPLAPGHAEAGHAELQLLHALEGVGQGVEQHRAAAGGHEVLDALHLLLWQWLQTCHRLTRPLPRRRRSSGHVDGAEGTERAWHGGRVRDQRRLPHRLRRRAHGAGV
mmetsp:Transcript_56386/g.164842  ORF Transcript_56386/g.164842 Transcript_56386/m.164842 type:complete len:367 (-) Transcript_56386:475-1575(-)